MNKKTILFLINGFGMEKKESYSIYDEKLMPTFDSFTKKYLFSTIKSNVNNLYDGYRNISLDVNELYHYSVIDQEIEFKKIGINNTLLKVKEDVETKKGNLHIFCLVDTSLKIVDHLQEFLKIVNPNRDKKIYLHCIISSSNIEDYNDLAKVFSKMNMELSEIAPIGLITGLSSIDNSTSQPNLNFYFRMFISKIGEKWQSFTQKFDVLAGTKVLPRDTKPFLVNTNFDLSINDTFMFLNYDAINLTNFINTLDGISFGETPNQFSYYSLYKVISTKNIPYMYEITEAKNSIVINLEKIGATGLVFCQRDEVNVINYFANGLKNQASNVLTFTDVAPYLENLELLIKTINQVKQDLIIFNLKIDDCRNTMELKNKLANIDKILNGLYENMNGSKYTLIISSLYGMSKVMMNEKEKVCQVIFSGKVPFIFIDDFITKREYLVEDGSINDLMKTVYKNIKKDSKYDSIVEKQNGLYKLFFK